MTPVSLQWVVFLILATATLFSAVLVIAVRNPINSAMSLVATFLFLAGIYAQLLAHTIAILQVLVYAGAIMVLFLFVIMLVHQRTSAGVTAFQHQWDVALLFLPVFLIPFLYILGTEKFADIPRIPDAFRMVGGRVVGNTEAVSWVLFRDYLLPFEVASVFLLVAMIGAVVLGMRSVEKVD